MYDATYSNAIASNVPPQRVIITSVVQPEVGAIIMTRCPDCHVTDIQVSIHAKKPEKGDLWKFECYCLRHMAKHLIKEYFSYGKTISLRLRDY